MSTSIEPDKRAGSLDEHDRRWLGRAGIGLVAATVGLLGRSKQAAAHGYHAQCCHLANPASSTHSCPSGTLFSWTCCQGRRLYACVECWDTDFDCDNDDPPSSCWNGCFFRSYVVNLSTAC